jgi:DNA-directed RNA polymerase specialized sigma24 family protein
MSNGYVIPIDPNELANRFSAPEPDSGTHFVGEIPDEEADDGREEEVANFLVGADYESRIAPLLNRIPQREADLIYLYYIQKKRQADIAEIFGVTQAAISYRLDRGLQRIKFLLEIPPVTEDDLREDLVEIFEPIDINILVGMWQTTCQSEVANRLGLTQGRVRHRFFKAVETLKLASSDDEKFLPYYTLYSSIASKHFNILREVSLPQWRGRGGDQCF